MFSVKTIKKTLLIISLIFANSFANDCAPFYCNMGSNESISECNGVITGSLTYPAGVNNNAASFDGASEVNFPGSIFDAESGTITLWVKKNATDEKGGIMEIGHLGGLNSFGMFYAYDSNIYFEMRNSNNDLSTVFYSDALSLDYFTHVAAMWDRREDTYHLKLFINGRYVSGQTLSGPFNHNNGFMKIGTAGQGEWYGRGECIVDEVRFFDWMLSDAEVYADYVYSANRHRHASTGKPVSTGPVQIYGKELYVNSQPFTVKGIGYQPIPYGMPHNRTTLDYVLTNQEIIARDVNYLKKMNANTVRLWAQLPYDTTLLDALADANMYAIMTFEVPASNDDPDIDYSEPDTIALYKAGITDYVNYFKNHPAVLAWAIGNENNLHYQKEMSDWYKLANELAKSAYEAEGSSYHPTVLINGYMLFFGDADCNSDDSSLNYVDMWGHNSYVRYDYHSYFCYYDKISAKPLIITEYGADAYDIVQGSINQDAQADWAVHEWEQIKENCAGGTAMEYSDEWDKCGSPASHDFCGYDTDTRPDNYSNEEWYGLMAIEDNGSSPDIMKPRKAYCALKQAFNPSFSPCDFDMDTIVNFNDFASLATYWLNTDCYNNCCCEGADFDLSEVVDMTDLMFFIENWLNEGS
jgi:hypothetical protein